MRDLIRNEVLNIWKLNTPEHTAANKIQNDT